VKSRLATISLITAAAAMIVGCSKSADSFSLLADASSYKQNAQYIPRKVDVLWVIDNSGSMANSQTDLAKNFKSFIQKFTATGSDFRMAVTTSDAFLAPYYNDNSKARLRPGKDLATPAMDHYIMTPATPDLENVFLTAIKAGTSGSGDERVFSSFKEALTNTVNNGFHRPEAFLAIIMVSDEEDFSHSDYTTGLDGYYFSEDYNDPKLHTVQSYVDFLTSYTAVGGAGKNFTVNTISILNQACLTKLQNSAQKIGYRYMELAKATGGKELSLCEDFSESLKVLADSIVALSAVFTLTREPIPESIVVTVNGVVIPQDANNGWTYNSASIAIQFNGSSIPAAGADVSINFDPAGVKN